MDDEILYFVVLRDRSIVISVQILVTQSDKRREHPGERNGLILTFYYTYQTDPYPSY